MHCVDTLVSSSIQSFLFLISAMAGWRYIPNICVIFLFFVFFKEFNSTVWRKSNQFDYIFSCHKYFDKFSFCILKGCREILLCWKVFLFLFFYFLNCEALLNRSMLWNYLMPILFVHPQAVPRPGNKALEFADIEWYLVVCCNSPCFDLDVLPHRSHLWKTPVIWFASTCLFIFM